MNSKFNLPVPVILDTDIGTDIDDLWALVMMLKSPELDIKYIISSTGDTTYRAKLIAKTLEIANRTDIPIGIGVPMKPFGDTHKKWIDGYNMENYDGIIHTDGVRAMIKIINESTEQISLISIGPLTNIKKALELNSRFLNNCQFIGMHGSIYKSHMEKDTIIAEYNVKKDIDAAKKTFNASWQKTITPLDTCGSIVLEGQRYQLLKNSNDPLLKEIFNCYPGWLVETNRPASDFHHKSSVLFDTVAIFLAFSNNWIDIQELFLEVNEVGITETSPKGDRIQVALNWKDKDAYLDFLTERLLSSVVQPHQVINKG